jgi:cytochrome c553
MRRLNCVSRDTSIQAGVAEIIIDSRLPGTLAVYAFPSSNLLIDLPGMTFALPVFPLRKRDAHACSHMASRAHTRHLAATAMLSAALTFSAMSSPARAAEAPDTIAQRALACAACHGKEGRATREGFFPRIAGKPAGYLYNQLINFREGRRQYPMMTYMVAHLSDAYLRELANYFSSLHLPYPPAQPADAAPAVLARGKTLALSGDAARNIPACVACHGASLSGRLPAIPSLVGLPRDYLNAQFGAWRNGARHAAFPDCMAEISQRLSVEDVAAVSGWLAAQPVPEDMRPEPVSATRLPLACGSAAEPRS